MMNKRKLIKIAVHGADKQIVRNIRIRVSSARKSDFVYVQTHTKWG